MAVFCDACETYRTHALFPVRALSVAPIHAHAHARVLSRALSHALVHAVAPILAVAPSRAHAHPHNRQEEPAHSDSAHPLAPAKQHQQQHEREQEEQDTERLPVVVDKLAVTLQRLQCEREAGQQEDRVLKAKQQVEQKRQARH